MIREGVIWIKSALHTKQFSQFQTKRFAKSYHNRALSSITVWHVQKKCWLMCLVQSFPFTILLKENEADKLSELSPLSAKRLPILSKSSLSCELPADSLCWDESFQALPVWSIMKYWLWRFYYLHTMRTRLECWIGLTLVSPPPLVELNFQN